MHRIIHQQRRQDGFTLLEVLIALLVLSIGLLGLASLQTAGLRSNQMANMRTVAVQRAYDISDRMRANPAGVNAQLYTLGITASAPDAAAVNCATAACTPTQMATFDLAVWLRTLLLPPRGLPGGRASITRDATGTLVKHTITVFWDEERRGVTGTGCGADTKQDLRCFQLTL